MTVNNDNTQENPVGRFMVAAGAVIANSKGQILLTKRSIKLDWHPGEWEILYGRLAQFEDVQSGVIRETKEELGIDIQIGKPLTVWHIYRGHEQSAYNELIGVTFAATTDATGIRLSDEHEEYGWFTPTEALARVSIEGIKQDIKAYIEFTNGMK